MGFDVTENGIYGIMPNNEWQLFNTIEEYEDAYYDMFYEMNNEFETELPEAYA